MSCSHILIPTYGTENGWSKSELRCTASSYFYKLWHCYFWERRVLVLLEKKDCLQFNKSTGFKKSNISLFDASYIWDISWHFGPCLRNPRNANVCKSDYKAKDLALYRLWYRTTTQQITCLKYSSSIGPFHPFLPAIGRCTLLQPTVLWPNKSLNEITNNQLPQSLVPNCDPKIWVCRPDRRRTPAPLLLIEDPPADSSTNLV